MPADVNFPGNYFAEGKNLSVARFLYDALSREGEDYDEAEEQEEVNARRDYRGGSMTYMREISSRWRS